MLGFRGCLVKDKLDNSDLYVELSPCPTPSRSHQVECRTIEHKQFAVISFRSQLRLIYKAADVKWCKGSYAISDRHGAYVAFARKDRNPAAGLGAPVIVSIIS